MSAIAQDEATPDGTRRLDTLKKYCDEQSSTSHEHVDFPDLLSLWSNASQTNVEPILSAVAIALTQFFRTVSHHVQFREFALSLCHSLLKRDQLRIFDRSLSSPRAKEHVITPCLELLTEIASFDGGALATNVFSRRDFLYRRLESILGQIPSNPTRSREVSAHQAALDFILANLKYLDAASKSELITHGRLIYSAIRSLPNVDAETVVNVLGRFEASILEDDKLTKHLKTRCFNSGALSMLAKLYDYEVEVGSGPFPQVRNALQHFLLRVCTSTKGILLLQSGWYPAGTTPEVLDHDENDMIDLGLDSPFHFDDYTAKIPVKNTALSTFLQTLKPDHDILQANLIIACFDAAPELVADYFTKRHKPLAPPADDPRWRGQFALLFSVVQLPVPEHCGWHGKLPLTPPPLSVVIESILPRPLDRNTIGKCLRMNESIMTISATRLLTVALEKLEAALKMFGNAPAEKSLWQQASTKITSLVVERIPSLHDIITALQKVDQGQENARTAVLECIATYLRVLPFLASSSKFDFGPSVAQALQVLQRHQINPDGNAVEAEESVSVQIQYLLQIVDISPATRWYHKATSDDDVSLVVQLIRSYIDGRLEGVNVRHRALQIVKATLENKGIFSTRGTRPLEALIYSLGPSKKYQPQLATYQFLDNCLSRTTQRPVKYLDQLEQAQHLVSDSTDLSLLACCVAEQWGYIAKKKEDKEGVKNVATWIARFFSALDVAGENYRVLTYLKEGMLEQCSGNDKARAALEKGFQRQQNERPTLPDLQLDTSDSLDEGNNPGDEVGSLQQQQQQLQQQQADTPILDLDAIFSTLTLIPKTLAGLDRWTKPDFESEIHTGRLADLIRCLISKDSEIRLQAFHKLQSVMHAVEESTYDEKTQLYLLLGELCETFKSHLSASNLANHNATGHDDLAAVIPSIVTEMAIQCLPVIAEPSSPFYRKTNSFLLRGPSWSPQHILTYWIHETFFLEPELNDADIPFHVPLASSSSTSGAVMNAQALEVEHLLDLLLNSLRTQQDMDLFRRAQVFTRLFSHYLAPITGKNVRRKILGVVYRATKIQGGSDTLITRAGLREWMAIAKTVRGHSGHGAEFGKVDEEVKGWIEALAREVERTCNSEAIARWERERKIFREDGGEKGLGNGSVVQEKERAVSQVKEDSGDETSSSGSELDSSSVADSDSDSASSTSTSSDGEESDESDG